MRYIHIYDRGSQFTSLHFMQNDVLENSWTSTVSVQDNSNTLTSKKYFNPSFCEDMKLSFQWAHKCLFRLMCITRVGYGLLCSPGMYRRVQYPSLSLRRVRPSPVWSCGGSQSSSARGSLKSNEDASFLLLLLSVAPLALYVGLKT
jgi:hypothetical protein